MLLALPLCIDIMTDAFSAAKGAANYWLIIYSNNVCVSSQKHVVPKAAFIFLLRESHSSWSKAKINTWHCFISPCSTGQIASMYLQTSSHSNCRLGWNKTRWHKSSWWRFESLDALAGLHLVCFLKRSLCSSSQTNNIKGKGICICRTCTITM